MSKPILPRPLRVLAPLLALGLGALVLAACSDDDTAPLSPTAPPAAEPTATAVQPTLVAPVCEGEGIGEIERTMSDVPPETGERRFDAYPDMVIDPAKTYVAEMQTSKGVIVIELAAAEAPLTVNSFVFLSCTGYFDGLTFHRVEKSPRPFVIQGGDPRGNSTGGPGYVFEDEFDESLRHDAPGILSMANAGPGTNGSQFFITLAPTPHLDDMHSIFGRVTEGMDAVNAIAQGDLILAVSIRES